MATTAEKTASALERQIRHLDGCPDKPRTETYPATRPTGERLTVARCLECGASTVE